MQKLSHYAALAALAVAGAAAWPAMPAMAQDRVQYKDVARDDVPRAVREEADDLARDARDVKFQRQQRDGKTFYSVHYTRDGRRMEARIDEQGKVVDGPHEARDQSSASRDNDRDQDRDRDRDRAG